jgi:hypothetical protein
MAFFLNPKYFKQPLKHINLYFMTYNEAKQIIDENFDVVNPHMVDSSPPHLILGSLIAPEGSPLNTLVMVDGMMDNDHLPNDEILLQLGLVGNNLIPFIKYKMTGDVIIMPLGSYKGSYLYTNSGNAS